MKTLLSSQYNISVQSLERSAIGFNNQTFKVSTPDGSFFYKIYQRIASEKILRAIGVMTYLHEKGFPVPVPLKNRENSFITYNDHQPSVLFNYLEGKVKTSFGHDELFDVGKTLAQMHRSLAAYQNRGDYMSKEKDLNSTAWYDNNIAELERMGDLEGKLIISEYQNLAIPKGIDFNTLPTALTHWDLRNENVLLNQGKISGITDFECFKYDNRLYDLVFSTIGFCMLDGTLNKGWMRTLFEGYESVSSLDEDERTAFPFLLKRMTWDKWCSIYVTSQRYTHESHGRRKSHIKYTHYKQCFMDIKDDQIL